MLEYMLEYMLRCLVVIAVWNVSIKFINRAMCLQASFVALISTFIALSGLGKFLKFNILTTVHF